MFFGKNLNETVFNESVYHIILYSVLRAFVVDRGEWWVAPWWNGIIIPASRTIYNGVVMFDEKCTDKKKKYNFRRQLQPWKEELTKSRKM